MNEVVSGGMTLYTRETSAESVPIVVHGTLRNDPTRVDKALDAISAKSNEAYASRFGGVVPVVPCD